MLIFTPTSRLVGDPIAREGSFRPICTSFVGASIARPRKHKTRLEQNKKATRYGVALCILFGLNCVQRTGCNAASAVDTLIRIDVSSIGLDFDSFHRTSICASAAACANIGVDFICHNSTSCVFYTTIITQDFKKINRDGYFPSLKYEY